MAERTRELEQAYRKLRELDQLKGNFIANVSHELRTPLTKIKGFNALLAAGDLGPLTDDQRQAVQVMGRGVTELERLVGDLIQFATGARGEMVLRPAAVPVADTLELALTAYRERAEAQGLELACRPRAPGVRARADAEKIRWVLDQLLDNAIKFTPRGNWSPNTAGREIWTRPGLDRRARSLILLAMLTALNRPHEIRLHVRGALNNGVTKEELMEVFMQCAIYCGIPAGMEAMRVAKEVFAEIERDK